MAEVESEKAKALSIDEQRAQAGMALFDQQGDTKVELDVAGATEFKEKTEAQIKKMEDEIATLTGKDNKKLRTELSKEVSNIKNKPEYIDACKVCKGLEPKNGFFAKAQAKPASPGKGSAKGGYSGSSPPEAVACDTAVPEEDKKKPEKEKKASKKQESAGLSKAERDELEKLKTDLIARKKELKESGMSGAACNKDEQVVAWVARMQELKLKEDPTLADELNKKGKKDDKKKKKGALSSEEQVEFDKLKNELEIYREKLVKEFGYTKKDIAADPDFKEMEAKVKEFEKRA